MYKSSVLIQEKMTVLDLKKGEIGFISSFENPVFTCKFYTLGIMPQSHIELVRLSPFGEAYYVKIGDSIVALRTEEAKSIVIKRLS